MRGSLGSRPLLVPHFRKRESCADGDYIENGMRWIGRQAQLVNLLPRSNAHVWRIEVGALLGQFLASLLGTLRCFMGEALGGGPDQVTSVGQRHMPVEKSAATFMSRGTGYTSYRHVE